MTYEFTKIGYQRRRTVLPGAAAAALALLATLSIAAPASAQKRHALSTFGDFKYADGFKHFDYVNPAAPKGGRLSTNGGMTFDTFNPYIVKGVPAMGLGLVFDSLMTGAGDEADTVYGLIAQSAEISADRRSVTFYLRPEAKFSDGTSVTAADIVFSFETLKEKGSPGLSLPLRDVAKAEAIDPRTVRYTFQGDRLRDLPVLVAGLPVLSKAYYATRDFTQTTLVEPAMGSGPYQLATFEKDKFVSYKRRADYWAKDLNVNVGRNNFDEVRFEYFRDRAIALEALKAGQIDMREEFTARDWSTAYDIAAVRDGRLLKTVTKDERPSGAQGFILNMRRAKFSDVRVRKALDLAFDFEWMNKNIFYGLYARTESYFENSDLKAKGLPSPEELALLEPFRAKLSKAVFEPPYAAPVSDGGGMNRENMKLASKLLDEAGWVIKDGKRVNAQGEILAIEFLLEEPSFLRVIGPFETNLKKLGIEFTARQVDSAQYESRLKSYEFDMLTQRFVMSLTPGVELKNYWSKEAASMAGSRNLAGITNPVVDALIDKVIEAKTRPELTAAARALDRVMRAEHVWVPNWYKAAHNIAAWNKFSWPATKPRYASGVIDTWWYDPEKAAKLSTN
jgi:microcin C transport system substrate-binding protein